MNPSPLLDLQASVLDVLQPAPVQLPDSATVADALDALRARATGRDVLYLYVVDADDHLTGVVPTRALLSAQPGTSIGDMALSDVVAIPDWATVLIAAEYFVSKKFLAFPVVNAEGRLLGQVDVSVFTDEVLSHARRSFDDIFQIIGVHATQGLSPWAGFRDRFPWLLSNIAGGLVCAVLAGMYESLLQAAVALALFIPVVLALAESISMQSVTLTLQGMHSSGTTWARVWPAIRREAAVAVLLGIGAGSLVGLTAWIWKGNPMLALVLAGAILLAMVNAALLGLVLPTALHAARRDPRIAAGPVVLATADVCTLIIYFTLAGWAVT
jgi:magnesium transporter